jgi:hypothetical protein
MKVFKLICTFFVDIQVVTDKFTTSQLQTKMWTWTMTKLG